MNYDSCVIHNSVAVRAMLRAAPRLRCLNETVDALGNICGITSMLLFCTFL